MAKVLDTSYSTGSGELKSTPSRIYNPCPNYIYFYHLGKVFYLPAYPVDTISDTTSANFQSTDVLARSAPIFSYSNSGPRSVTFNFSLHREMMQKIKKENTIYNDLGDDYVDELIKALQASVLPNYGASQKLVDPPIVAVRIDNEVFIKGVCQGSCSITYKKPILSNGKYAVCDIQFDVKEIEPYDAQLVLQAGSFRVVNDEGNISMNTSLSRNTYSTATTGNTTQVK